MTAQAYIQYDDVPETLLDDARWRVDDTGVQFVGFDGCPLIGQVVETPEGVQIEFAWPHSTELRHALGDWFTHHGIHFTVVA
ncbi:phage portal protein [Paraburkholderia sp. Tr-20389]|uniref:phage portal protein n=1 Tax=Paraburkholderia sp. Tr-20389 TaxID=2703903 RepID=UPI0019814875|nr:phage portal protein [Paraburkholderia sp. Tr-20389]MBN3758172.1 phage portal protein [Paraburkholderia sp. Tr-20389]